LNFLSIYLIKQKNIYLFYFSFNILFQFFELFVKFVKNTDDPKKTPTRPNPSYRTIRIMYLRRIAAAPSQNQPVKTSRPNPLDHPDLNQTNPDHPNFYTLYVCFHCFVWQVNLSSSRKSIRKQVYRWQLIKRVESISGSVMGLVLMSLTSDHYQC
jgi:hypothetical protein